MTTGFFMDASSNSAWKFWGVMSTIASLTLEKWCGSTWGPAGGIQACVQQMGIDPAGRGSQAEPSAARGPVTDFIVAIVEMIIELPCLLRKEADLVESGGNTIAMRLEHSFLARP